MSVSRYSPPVPNSSVKSGARGRSEAVVVVSSDDPEVVPVSDVPGLPAVVVSEASAVVVVGSLPDELVGLSRADPPHAATSMSNVNKKRDTSTNLDAPVFNPGKSPES